MKREFHIVVTEDNSNVVDLLAKESGFSKQDIKRFMQKGIVWLDNENGTQRIRRADKSLKKNNTVHCYYNEAVINTVPPEPTLLADEKDYSVWNKPSGMLSQGSKWGDHCTIHRWIEQHYHFADNAQRNCFIVHRLDKATQGLILVAHKKSTATQLAKLFENRQINKYYYAVVQGEFPVKFNQHLDREPTVKPILIESKIDDKLAKTYVQCIQYDAEKNQSLLDIKIETGRKHQIRIHLNDYGYPIVGDRLYGNDDSDNNIDLQLQCYRLCFTSPVDQSVKDFQLTESLTNP